MQGSATAPMVAVEAFFWGLVSAITVKLASSIDDVLWLAPFLTSNVYYTVRWQNAVVYLSVCMIQTVVAMFIARSGSDALKYLTKDAKNAWSIDKILTVSAGTLLALYAVKLTYEFFTEEDEDGENGDDTDAAEFGDNKENREGDIEANVPSQVELASADKGLLQKAPSKELGPKLVSQGSRELGVPKQEQVRSFERTTVEESTGLVRQTSEGQVINRRSSRNSLCRQTSEGEDKKRQQTLFMIAFIGSVDDLTLFVPMLVGKTFNWFELMFGAFIAGSTIVLLCVFIGLCKPVADCLSRIPLALIVATFAIVLLTKAFLMG